ncbi:MAG: nicotinate (nicotinamide) nucleotide adenylyltransferase [Oscillospiraceae bacterium]
MTVMLYGGSFNPPHPAHVRAARLAYEAIKPDRLIVLPAADPPHKTLPQDSPPPEERLLLTRLAFRDFPQAEVSELELKRGGESYTSDTVEELKRLYPGAELCLVVGADMLLYFEQWHEFKSLLGDVSVVALSRERGDRAELLQYAERLRREYGARVRLLNAEPLPMSSSELRSLLRERGGADALDSAVYARIIAVRDYGARPQFSWLREQSETYLKPKRVPHVRGCEQEAVRLAERWGAPADSAAEAAILHDITKALEQEEQLLLCEKYGIIIDTLERESKKLLHARTGAALARELYGVPDDIYEAIRWHTTGKPAMTLLERIVYLADYIEPTRDFQGVDELRRLAYENINSAMALGLSMSLEELRGYGAEPHGITVSALEYYRKEI